MKSRERDKAIMIAPRTGRWTQPEIAALVQAHSNGDISTEEGAARWGLAHSRTPEAMFQKLVDLGLERRRIVKGEIQPLSDDELISLVASRLAAKGLAPERSSSLLSLLRVGLGLT